MHFSLKIKTFVLSFLIRNINGDNFHNLNKFIQIYKVWSNVKLDSIKGDYIEFGVFKGKSLYHSFKTANKLIPDSNRVFWGLDSFEGFPVDNHDFYTGQNFASSKELVEKNFKRFENVRIIEGYFDKSLLDEELQNIKEISFAFIDCDIYESAKVAFDFIKDRLSNGAFVMIDDFTSVDKNGNYIAKCFYEEFRDKDILYFDTYSNGQTYRIFSK